jgi:hypothetical protein
MIDHHAPKLNLTDNFQYRLVTHHLIQIHAVFLDT